MLQRDLAFAADLPSERAGSAFSRLGTSAMGFVLQSSTTRSALPEAQRFYGPKVTGRSARPLPDPARIHTEQRRAGVTLELLHLEHLGQHPDGFGIRRFACITASGWTDSACQCARYTRRAKT
jgi:hypothetical protein